MDMKNDCIEKALSVLEAGGTLLYPTDTIWGIGCDATNAEAVERIYAIKERDHSKSMLILCADEAMRSRYVDDTLAPRTADSDRPTTIIFPQARHLPENLLAADGSIGIRIPDMEFCQQLLKAFDRPIVSTSANLSGEPSPRCFNEISMRLIERVDHVVENRPEYNRESTGSRIIKLTDNGIITIRE